MSERFDEIRGMVGVARRETRSGKTRGTEIRADECPTGPRG
jgi:hypothetical protein